MPPATTHLAPPSDGQAPTSRASTSALAGDLRIAVMRLARRLRNERADVDLTLTQLSALAALERCGPTTPGHLASVERVRPPSMTRVLGGLHDRGLIERTAHPTDGRQVLVAATDDARVLLRADRRRREAWLAQQLATLDPEECRALREVLPILETLVSE
ncbi:MAG: MarR family transcriptional regulator [Actinomycetes bacterium]|jgi:DNA-binding MarR family transcriptional regulator|nr:MarR family transcriptional regulator [Actinomycetes bacterium]